MRALKRSDADREERFDSGIADECDAFLAGSLVEALRGRGVFPPVWAWLNEAAHAEEREIRRLAEVLDPDAPDVQERTRGAVARAVVGALPDRDLAELQREILVPLELRLAGSVTSPRRLIELVGRALYL